MTSAAVDGFRARVRSGELLLGAFIQTGSAVAAEIMGRSGIAWALIDLEHGAGTEADLIPQLHALRGVSTPAVVRVESGTRLRVGRALDLGAAGIMVPQVNTGETAREVAGFLRYPPVGVRGVALSARGAGYGAAGHGDVASLGEALLGIAQVETVTAVEHVDAIAEIDGIDVLFVGPSDLSHSLGIPGAFDNPAYGDAVDRIVAAAARHGKILGVHLPSPAAAGRYLELGFTFVSVAGDGQLLGAATRRALSDVAAAASQGNAASPRKAG